MKQKKYLNRTFYDEEGKYWHSSGEHQRWHQLRALERAGRIQDLKRQVRYPLDIRFTVGDEDYVYPILWIADFDYMEDGVHVSEDYKSSFTERLKDFSTKRRLFQIMYGRDIRVYVAGRGTVYPSKSLSKIRKVSK